jgi:hypothetical protein
MLGMRLLALLGGLCMAGPVQAFAPRGVPASGSLQPALFRGVLRPRAGVRGLRLANDDYFDVANRRVLVQAAGVAVLSGLARSDRRCVCVRARLSDRGPCGEQTHAQRRPRTHARAHARSEPFVGVPGLQMRHRLGLAGTRAVPAGARLKRQGCVLRVHVRVFSAPVS